MSLLAPGALAGGPELEEAQPSGGEYVVEDGGTFDTEVECEKDPEGDPVTVVWYKNGDFVGSAEDKNGFSPDHSFSFSEPGTYRLSAVCEDDIGNRGAIHEVEWTIEYKGRSQAQEDRYYEDGEFNISGFDVLQCMVPLGDTCPMVVDFENELKNELSKLGPETGHGFVVGSPGYDLMSGAAADIRRELDEFGQEGEVAWHKYILTVQFDDLHIVSLASNYWQAAALWESLGSPSITSSDEIRKYRDLRDEDYEIPFDGTAIRPLNVGLILGDGSWIPELDPPEGERATRVEGPTVYILDAVGGEADSTEDVEWRVETAGKLQIGDAKLLASSKVTIKSYGRLQLGSWGIVRPENESFIWRADDQLQTPQEEEAVLTKDGKMLWGPLSLGDGFRLAYARGAVALVHEQRGTIGNFPSPETLKVPGYRVAHDGTFKIDGQRIGRLGGELRVHEDNVSLPAGEVLADNLSIRLDGAVELEGRQITGLDNSEVGYLAGNETKLGDWRIAPNGGLRIEDQDLGPFEGSATFVDNTTLRFDPGAIWWLGDRVGLKFTNEVEVTPDGLKQGSSSLPLLDPPFDLGPLRVADEGHGSLRIGDGRVPFVGVMGVSGNDSTSVTGYIASKSTNLSNPSVNHGELEPWALWEPGGDPPPWHEDVPRPEQGLRIALHRFPTGELRSGNQGNADGSSAPEIRIKDGKFALGSLRLAPDGTISAAGSKTKVSLGGVGVVASDTMTLWGTVHTGGREVPTQDLGVYESPRPNNAEPPLVIDASASPAMVWTGSGTEVSLPIALTTALFPDPGALRPVLSGSSAAFSTNLWSLPTIGSGLILSSVGIAMARVANTPGTSVFMKKDGTRTSRSDEPEPEKASFQPSDHVDPSTLAFMAGGLLMLGALFLAPWVSYPGFKAGLIALAQQSFALIAFGPIFMGSTLVMTTGAALCLVAFTSQTFGYKRLGLWVHLGVFVALTLAHTWLLHQATAATALGHVSYGPALALTSAGLIGFGIQRTENPQGRISAGISATQAALIIVPAAIITYLMTAAGSWLSVILLFPLVGFAAAIAYGGNLRDAPRSLLTATLLAFSSLYMFASLMLTIGDGWSMLDPMPLFWPPTYGPPMYSIGLGVIGIFLTMAALVPLWLLGSVHSDRN